MARASARHLLVNSEELCNELKAKIDAGADFAEVAKEHSSCPSGADGGDLGTFSQGQMVPEFEQALLQLDKDQISELVETQFGFHIIKKTDHKPATQLTFDQAKGQIKDVLMREKSQEVIHNLIQELKGKYEVQYAQL